MSAEQPRPPNELPTITLRKFPPQKHALNSNPNAFQKAKVTGTGEKGPFPSQAAIDV
jgi:hypothetical protein